MAGRKTDPTGYDPRYWVFHVRSPEDISWVKEQGFGGVGIWGASREDGTITYRFSSPALEGCAWAQCEGDVVSPIAAEAHAQGLKVMVNMEGVNPWHWEAGRTKWTPELLQAVMADIHDCGADRWFSECFNAYSDFFFALAEKARAIGMEFQEGADPSILYGWASFHQPTNYAQLCEPMGIASMYQYYLRRDVGFDTASLAQEGALGFGFGDGFGYPRALVYSIRHNWGVPPEYWQGVLRAICLITGLQFRVDDIMLIGVNRERGEQLDVRGTKAWIAGYVEKQNAERRPLLNVVVQLTAGSDAHWTDLTVSMDGIASGAFQSGCDLVCTTEPLSDADAYWVYAPGHDDRGTLDLTPEIARLFRGEKSVFLQCGGDVPNGSALTERWREALRACGVDPDAALSYGDLPAAGVFEDTTFRYTGYLTKGEGEARRHGTLIPSRAVTGTVHAAAGDVPLIVGQNGKYLIPAACIGWEMKHPVGRLLSGYGTKPQSNVWGIAGEKVSALLAIEDTKLELDIPELPDGARIHVVHWDKHHEKVYEDTTVYHAPYARELKQYDLLVIDSVPGDG